MDLYGSGIREITVLRSLAISARILSIFDSAVSSGSTYSRNLRMYSLLIN